MASTFADLITRVETTNANLQLVRDAIVEESIDSTSAIIDTIRDSRLGGSGASDDLFSEENRRESEKYTIDRNKFLEGIHEGVMKMVELMSAQPNKNDEGMPDWMKFALAEAALDRVPGRAPVIAGGGGDDGKKGKKGKGTRIIGGFKGLVKRGGIVGIIALLVNEAMVFFFDKTIADLPGILAEETRTLIADIKNIDWSAEWEAFSIGDTLNEGINSAIRLAFGEGTLESGFAQAGVGASIGFAVAGPLGAGIGGILGFALGMIKEDEAIKIKDKMFTFVDDFLGQVFDFLSFGVFDDGPFDSAIDNANAWLSDKLFGTTYMEDRKKWNESQKKPARPKSEVDKEDMAALQEQAAEISDANYRSNLVNLRNTQARLNARFQKAAEALAQEDIAMQWVRSEEQYAKLRNMETTPQLEAARRNLAEKEIEVMRIKEEAIALREAEANYIQQINATDNQQVQQIVNPLGDRWSLNKK